MVRDARGRSIAVFVGTLLLERAGGRPAHPELVVPLNDAIKAMVAAEGVFLVDLSRHWGASPTPS